MSIFLSSAEFRFLRDFIEEICAIRVADSKVYLIENRLFSLLQETGCQTFTDFYKLAKSGAVPGLVERVINLMTTNETLWLRDSHPFSILREKLLPLYAQQLRDNSKKKIRIWSAACSTGQEPYSIAMTILAEAAALRLKPQLFEICATDISATALQQAISGEYDNIALNRGLIEEYRLLFFREKGRGWEIVPEVKKLVSFKKFNLQDRPTSLGRFDLVFCRNVAIYFSKAMKTTLFSRIAEVLNPGGHLFLGATESITGYSDQFEMLMDKRGFYYRVRKELVNR